MLTLFLALLSFFVVAAIIMAILLFTIFREEIKEAYQMWRDEKYGIDFHKKD